MPQQTASSVWMVRPAVFYSNTETIESNTFQKHDDKDYTAEALLEFDAVVDQFRKSGVKVFVSQGTDKQAPDAIFSNNWISFLHNGLVVLFPMMSGSRRRERGLDWKKVIHTEFETNDVLDLTSFEESNRFLEGTGSIVFDHINSNAFTVLGSRTDKALVEKLCEKINYSPVIFHASDKNGKEVYHTNVVMNLGERFGIICTEAIKEESERERVIAQAALNGREIIEISLSQMEMFAGNMLEMKNSDGNSILVLSQTALNSLTADEQRTLEKFTSLLPVDVKFIETYGGGSIRCMITEIFLPNKKY